MLTACEIVVATAADHTAEAADEQQIEHDIGQRRDDEVIERPLAVAKRVHDALAHVVHDDGQHAEEIILEIRDRVRQDLRRGAHPAQERRRQQNAHDGQHGAAEQTQHHVGMNGLGYAAIVARAEVPRDRDACAHGKPRKKADEQEDERPGRTDGRQRLIAEKPTDDQRVRRIVKLLKDLTEEHGHGKLRDQLPRTAFRHIQRTSAQGASFPSVQRQLTRYLSVKNTASTAVTFSIPEMRTKSKPLSSRHIQRR